ncbi:hybrid sensor histidine kinase/response regulator [Halorubrum ezzemoulense]|uniref:hybrid sensor histidine kinase/response regulator n=1 Tax=Halorubrum ezzemoulense TaxID=337243 RepID=UPI00232E45B5|nr:PAS domain S-box protein [Halorubrum ezzemoulense]MDB2239220.1 PAS domain S-box protein [Halorubrum ezzemoulense]MDB2242773.1 PAS domain S-box protein [Halorubrum ezzemoulense]MDB2249292.1 PAS domain S-box protein [Halorubrum ezzemoulense]MDB2253405.1 PAS domain S-box protein [Halorubrum ezzemoulense]MDB2286349.1 PAS domain S-box protein [Halorubrum ezzemoulense]
MRDQNESIKILHVDDEPGFADMAATFIEREDDRFDVKTVTSPDEGLQHIKTEPVDCIVSDHDMPEQTGIEFLESVRDEYPSLPFILYTGKGSETIASDAISAGVTDYLQKGNGTSQYTVLTNRIRNAVDKYHTQTELAEREKRLNLFFEQSPLGVVEWDKQFNFVRLNETAEEIIGYAEGDLIGHSWQKIVPESDREPVADVVSSLLENKGGYYSVNENVRKDDERVICEWYNRVVTDENGDVVAIFSQFQDITDRKAREQELQRQNDLFKKSQEIANVGAWEYDIQGEQTIWTDQVYNIHDRPREWTPNNEAVIDLYHPDDRPQFTQAFRDAVEAGEPYDLELRVQLADRETRWVRTRAEPQAEDGEIVRLRGAIQDITESKQRIREIRELKRQYQSLAENIPDGAVFLFNDDLHYVRARGTELETVGLSPDEIEGATPHDVFPEETADELAHYFTEALDGKTSTFTQSLGEDTYRNRVAPVRNGDGAITYGIALAQNVTNQISRKQRLEAQNEQLEEFAKVVSHDLRNPLRVVDGYLELLRKECESEHIDRITQAVDRMDELIEDLLLLARQGEPVGETETVDLAEIVETCFRTVETDQATVDLRVDRLIEADQSRLRQLLENLFRNAVEHGGAGVTITVGEVEGGFYVEDDGPGIPEDEREDVFNAGYSTVEDGTGFGLSIISEVADAHGWDIRVTDGTSGGARFEVTGIEVAT